MIELKVKCQEHGEIMRAYVENATIWIDPKSCSYCYDKAKEGQPTKAWQEILKTQKSPGAQRSA